MVDINKLLKKKKLTGAELGRLGIANLMLGYKKALEANNPKQELPIHPSKFMKMLETLKDPAEVRIYNCYMAIHEWVVRTMQASIAQEQQAQLQYTKLINIINNAIIAEDIYNCIETIPLIMTEKQYNDTIERKGKNLLNTTDTQKATLNGIAILKSSNLSHNIDKETGYYITPNIKKILENFSLENFFTEHKNCDNNIEEIQEIRHTFMSSLYFIKAFNICLDLITSMYKVEEVNIARAHIEFFEEKVKTFNNTVLTFYDTISNKEHEALELKKKKLRVLKDIFYPIDLKEITVPKKKIENTKKTMEDFKAFLDDTLNPANLICLYNPKAMKEELKTTKRKGI